MKKFKIYDYNKGVMGEPFDITKNPKYWVNKIVDGEWLQFTGKLDVYGNEIYEGDVVNVEEGEITYGYSCWTGIVKMFDGFYIIENKDFVDSIFLFEVGIRIRIIDNIYESPFYQKEESE